MIWDKFKDFFHPSWHRHMKPFIESEECDEIYRQLKERGSKGVKIAPLSTDTWNAFRYCDYDKLKVVMMGMAPYHTFKNGAPVADGLCMSCSKTGLLQPSLINFYDAYEKEMFDGMNLKLTRDPDLKFLADQGVLLLNAGLTVSENMAGSHNHIWQPFIKYLIQDVLGVYNTGLIYWFLGKDSAKYEKLVTPFANYAIVTEHPAASAYRGDLFNSEGAFRKINTLLSQNNGKESVINFDNGEKSPF